MKPVLLTLASLATLATIPVAPLVPPTASPAPHAPVPKTVRMSAIERKYHVRIAGIMVTPSGEFWVFMERQDDAIFPEFPVTIAKDGSNHDMDVALVAASNCASYYEANIRVSASPTPARDGAFTMPTHPPGEVER